MRVDDPQFALAELKLCTYCNSHIWPARHGAGRALKAISSARSSSLTAANIPVRLAPLLVLLVLLPRAATPTPGLGCSFPDVVVATAPAATSSDTIASLEVQVSVALVGERPARLSSAL